MGPRPLHLTAVAAALALTACDGGGGPAPVPTPSPTAVVTSTPTGSPVPTDESCPPIPDSGVGLVTLPLRDSARLPDGGRIGFAEWKGDVVVIEVVRATPGCPTDAAGQDLRQGGGGTVRGVQVDVVAVTGPGVGGSVPTVQLRFGPPA